MAESGSSALSGSPGDVLPHGSESAALHPTRLHCAAAGVCADGDWTRKDAAACLSGRQKTASSQRDATTGLCRGYLC